MIPPPPPAYGPMLVDREPSADTPRVQAAVAVYLGYSALVSIIGAFFVPAQIRRSIAISTARAGASGQPLPPGFQDTVTSFATFTAYTALAFGLAIAVVLLLGALLRWRWTYYAQMILGFLGVVSIFQSLVGLGQRSIALPVPLVLASLLGSAVAIGLSVWMFVLWRRYRAAWAVREVTRPIS